MSNDNGTFNYIDLVIMTDGHVCRAPGFSDIRPGYRVGQQAFEAAYPDKDFLSIFGRNYL